MTKVKVVNEFYDKYTKRLHKVGQSFEADEARIAEIMEVSRHLIEVQKEPVKRTKKVVNADEI